VALFSPLSGFHSSPSWNNDQQNENENEQERLIVDVNGFGSISRREFPKPIIAAVVGGAYGGGVEMILNCDIVIASDDAKFALPEVKRGVVAIQGGSHKQSLHGCIFLALINPLICYLRYAGIPRLARISGHQVRIILKVSSLLSLRCTPIIYFTQ
jgi:hypothetical protein